VLNLNKPAGLTSHDVVDAVRAILGTRRVGHTGTLDPPATGVLPVCVGRATKIAQYLTQADKEYLITMRLGVTTDTLDGAGRVLTRVDALGVTRAELEATLPRFQGEILQTPPLYSAKRIGGQRLYRLARRGETVERQPVRLMIHRLALVEVALPDVRLLVGCSKGTYARALCDDIGRALGCGAYLHELVRTRSGRFEIATAIGLEALRALVEAGRLGEVLVPVSEALAHLPAIRVGPEFARPILQGGGIPAGAVVASAPEVGRGATVRVLGPRGQLLCLAQALLDSADLPGPDPRRPAFAPTRVFRWAADA
jgi:tRNA pseudouridine55 synthase